MGDPRLFNYILIALFFIAAVRWGFERNWAQSAYWGLGGLINCVVTWGFK